MDEGDADAGGGEVEEGVEAEDEAVEPCQIMYPHSAPSLNQELFRIRSSSLSIPE